MIKRILFVCLGNICRSPMAEGIMRKKIEERKLPLEVDSAGTANYHVGESPDARAIHTAKTYGVDLSGLRGRQFTATDFEKFDFIFAMDSSNYRNIVRLAKTENEKAKVQYFLNDSENGHDVPDPWFGEPEGFFPVYDLIDRTCAKLLDEIFQVKTK